MMRIEILIAAALVLGLSFLGGRSCAPDRPAGPTTVLIDTVYAEAERVDLVKPSLGQKLTTTAVKPTQTRVASAPNAAGRQAVVIYCRPAIAVQTSAVGDSATSNEEADLPHNGGQSAVLPDFQGRIRGSRVTLYSTLNDGRRWAADYRPRGHWSFETDGDSVLLRSDRFWVRALRGGKRCAIGGGAGAIAGGILGLLVQEPRGGAIGGAAAGCVVGAF